MENRDVPHMGQSIKQLKRDQKVSWREQKLKQKLARKEEKLARKLARAQQRVVVSYVSTLDRAKVAELLEEILVGLKAGMISVEQGDQELKIHPPDVVRVSVRARQTVKSESIRMRVRWPRTTPAEDDRSVKITAE